MHTFAFERHGYRKAISKNTYRRDGILLFAHTVWASTEDARLHLEPAGGIIHHFGEIVQIYGTLFHHVAAVGQFL